MPRLIRLLAILSLSCRGSAADLPSWAFGPFDRAEDENPVLLPRDDTTFDCPLQRRPVKFESKDVFNPAAVIKDGRVNLLYRAEVWCR